MKNFLNINKQRIFVFIFAFLFVGIIGFSAFGLSVSAANLYPYDQTYPFGFLFDFDLTNVSLDDATLPVSFICEGVEYQYILVRNGSIYYSQNMDSVDALLAYDPLSSIPWGVFSMYQYIVVQFIPDDFYNVLLKVFEEVGNVVWYDGLYQIGNSSEYLGTNQSLDFLFKSSGLSFTGLRLIWSGLAGSDLYYVGDNESLFFVANYVNDNGTYILSSVDEQYRNLEFSVPYIPADASEARFMTLFEPYHVGFIDRVTSGLTAVISWVGTVVTAIVSGDLVALRPLVAIGIAVSAILLVVYLIRRFIWGD